MGELFDLSNFGLREFEKAGELLTAYAKGRPDQWYDRGVKLGYNGTSGYVFLTNDSGQILMLDGDRVAIFYLLSYDGYEGFIEDLYDDFQNGYIREENYDELVDYLEGEHMLKEAEEVRKAIHNLKHESEE